MYRFFIQEEAVSGDYLTITGEDYNHIKNVLRIKCGEKLEAVDEDRFLYLCRVEEYGENEVRCAIEERRRPDTELPCEMTLYMSLLKSDKPEFVIQKAVELGAVRVVPVITKRTIVRLDEKKAVSKRRRWQAVAEAAAKQSKRAVIPVVSDVLSFEDALKEAASSDVLLIPYEQEKDISRTRDILRHIKKGMSIAAFIGPEGGFEAEEVAAVEAVGGKSITLGRRILRAETAAVTMLSILMYELDE